MFGRHVERAVDTGCQHVDADQDQRQRHGAHAVLETHCGTARAAAPVPLPDQDQVQVEHEDRDGDEVKQALGRDQTDSERFELPRDGHLFEELVAADHNGRQRRQRDQADEHGDRADQRTENERHRRAVGQIRRHHPGAQQSAARQPVAEIGGGQQSHIRLSNHRQHHGVRQREEQGHAVNGDHRQVLPDQDFQVRDWQGEEQFFGPQLPLLGPDTHRDGRNDEQQQRWKPLVELVQAGHVVGKELRLKRGECAEQDEGHDEQIADDSGEVTPEVPLEHGEYNMTSHLAGNLEEISDNRTHTTRDTNH